MERVSRVSLTCLLAAALLVGGCGSDAPESAPPAPSSTPSTSTSHHAQSKPSASATPTPSAAPRHGGRHKVGELAPHARPRRTEELAHLLSPADLPAVAGAWAVAAGEGGGDDPVVGACQKTGLGTIGAMESVVRTFTADGATATQVVARFPDSRTAWRAHEVLASWRDDCAERLGNATVGDLEDVTVPAGSGSSYRAELRKRTAGLGILRNGSYLTVVEISATKYPKDWEPSRVAVRRIARTF